MLQNRKDWGRRLSASIKNQFWGGQTPRGQYSQLPTSEGIELPEIRDPESSTLYEPNQKPELPPKPSLRSMLTRNIVLILSQHWLQALHTSTYNTLLILLLSSPVVTRSSSSSSTNHPSSSSPLLFTGGLGLTPHAVGLATASIGIIGLPIQILLYPPLSAALGTLRSYRLFLWPSILVYTTLPFLTLIAQSSSSSSSTTSSSSVLLWVALITALGTQVLARAFVGPATVVLVNNCTPHPQLLATVHGLAQSISSAARMVGPVLGGSALAWAEERGCAGAPFWGIAGLAVVNWGVLWWVVEEED
ncbi:hypothetical protein DIS24_g10123 [Lasiodiplodia hormozganensis]|uniref:Uncharacterized protein n=1 Tax=Lasiodiplodia hormozganensis TaxID=869390 RepID=A0AA39XQ37_9PEZI|nr:hypothetical protein DIS24_g10123 [Lasiodiplodia hormozganensis]